MSLRKWAVVVGVLAGAVLTVELVRPRRNRRPPLWRVLAVMALSRPGFDWNPISWITGAGHLLSNAYHDIEHWVVRAIKAALSDLAGAISFSITHIEQGISDAWSLAKDIQGVADFAWRWIEHSAEWIGRVIGSFWSKAWTDLVAPAIRAVDHAWRWTVGELHKAVEQIGGLLHWLEVEVINPMKRWLDQIATWFDAHLIRWWHDIWANTIGPVVADVRWLWDHAVSWILWLASTAYNVVQAVIKAIEWVIWFGEHTFDDIRALARDVEGGIGPGWIFHATQGDHGAANDLESEFVRLMGG